ncbi:hypothetical protein P7K49_006059, partial [Saguinus oedipus]
MEKDTVAMPKAAGAIQECFLGEDFLTQSLVHMAMVLAAVICLARSCTQQENVTRDTNPSVTKQDTVTIRPEPTLQIGTDANSQCCCSPGHHPVQCLRGALRFWKAEGELPARRVFLQWDGALTQSPKAAQHPSQTT